jgi:3-hydroxyacyl-CoA dehydrogenase
MNSNHTLTSPPTDSCVTTSLGPRWACAGPFLANALGGGGGSDGFRHFLEHLGPAIKGWTEDMQAHAFSWSPDSLNKLTTSFQEGFAGKDMGALEARRDEKLIGILKMKEGRRGSV